MLALTVSSSTGVETLRRAQFVQNAQPIHAGQINIENDQIVDPIHGHLKAGFSVEGHIDRVAFFLQALPDKAGHLLSSSTTRSRIGFPHP